jgi:Asp-tRNA(Asn)/Glu-tRNA(Gln) amidotransferase A subunit family amidase
MVKDSFKVEGMTVAAGSPAFADLASRESGQSGCIIIFK